MSEPASISSGIAERYAAAIFESAKEQDDLAQLEQDVDDLAQALDDSADLRDLIHSPIYSPQRAAEGDHRRRRQDGRLDVDDEHAGADGVTSAASSCCPQMIAQLREMIAEEKGEVTADVTSAKALTDAQRRKLAETLKAKVGKDVKTQHHRR